MGKAWQGALLTIALAALAACGERARLPVTAGIGPQPVLPPPKKTLLPTVNIAPARGWPEGARPTAAAGLDVASFADGLDHPRWLYVLPNGDVLVAETNAPPRPENAEGLKGWVMKLLMSRAGAAVPSADRITLLRDADGDGVVGPAHGVPRRPAFAVRHGAGGRRPLRRQHRRPACASRTRRAPYGSTRRARTSSICRPARSTITGPRTWSRARTAARLYVDRRLEQQRRRERHRGRGGARGDLGDRSRERPPPDLRLRPAQSGRASRSSPTPARSGPPSTSATSSAATSSPTT